LAQGLSKILNPDELSIIVNTADDFEYLGLYISPDIDTVCYTLAGMANPATGWGIKNDTFFTFDAIKKLSGPDWFLLGDIDLATHFERTRLLKAGKSLTEVTRLLNAKFSIKHHVLPMSNQRVSTLVQTKEYGVLSFQEYFVKHKFQPIVQSFKFEGMETAKPTKDVVEALSNSDSIIICPSNPFVSIDPIISLNGLREIIQEKFVICISPIVGGKAVKGPLDKMFEDLGIKSSANSVVEHYNGLIDFIFIDNIDKEEYKISDRSSIIIQSTDILIPDLPSRVRLAKEIINIIKKKI